MVKRSVRRGAAESCENRHTFLQWWVFYEIARLEMFRLHAHLRGARVSMALSVASIE
jgi:hypothetical protein